MISFSLFFFLKFTKFLLKFILYLMSRIQEILHKRSCQKLGGRSEEHTLYCYSSRTYMYTTGLFKPRLWHLACYCIFCFRVKSCIKYTINKILFFTTKHAISDCLSDRSLFNNVNRVGSISVSK